MKHVLVFALVVAALSLAGCSSSVSVGGSDHITTLQNGIAKDLPTKLKSSGQGDIKVSKVTCKSVGGSDTNYSCVASIHGTDSSGKQGSADLDIVGTCGSNGCDWKTK